MKVFSKRKFLAAHGKSEDYRAFNKICDVIGIPEEKRWPNECDGKEVVDGKCMGYDIHDNWCVEKQSEKYKIEIKSDGYVTQADMIINGKIVKTANAFLNPQDKFNFRTGAELAFNRLFAKKIEHDGCEGCKWECEDEEKCVARDCRHAFTWPENVSKPDKYTKKRNFEVGDRVVCVNANDGSYYTIATGEHGRVIENRSRAFENWIAVEFDHALPCAHAAMGAGKRDHCFWIKPCDLRHE